MSSQQSQPSNKAEKEVLVELIESLKVNRCLWDTKCVAYANRDLRRVAHGSLLEIYRKIQPNATIDLLKKKIENLKGSFRRELRKVKASEATGAGSGQTYTPRLWFYELMSFLEEKEMFREGSDTLEEDESEMDIVDTFQSYKQEIPSCDVGIYTTVSEGESLLLDESESTNTNPEIQSEIQILHTSSCSDLKRKATSKSPNQSRMKKVDAKLEDVEVIKDVGCRMCANKPVTQTTKSTDDVFGEYIASKLRGYSHVTKCFVQHKINNILFEADMGMYEQPGGTIP